MPRSIKFRAWAKNEYEMFDVAAVEWNEHDEVIGVKSQSAVAYDHDDGGIWELAASSVELMQFTGLTDKNGKEIYEGDTIKNDQVLGEGSTLDVKYYEDRAGFWPFLFWEMHEITSCEVIGNIYENSDLLV